MTSEAKVKQVHPEALAVYMPNTGFWRILESPASMDALATAAHSESWAWGEAARKIKARQE